MPFLRSFSVNTPRQHPFPFNVPGVRFAHNIALDDRITIFTAVHYFHPFPILMGMPGARLYETQEKGIQQVDFRDTEHFRITHSFLNNPEMYLRYL